MQESAYSASSANDTGRTGHLPGRLTVRTRTEGDRLTVMVRGELCLDAGGALQDGLFRALDDSVSGLDLDLSGVGFCDCSGLNALLRVRRQALADGKSVTVRATGPVVERLLELTGTGPLFTADTERGGGPGPGTEVAQLRRAMRTRPTIDLARGVLMASFGLSPDQAWDVLVQVSQHTNTKLHRLAGELVEAVNGGPPSEPVQREVATAVARLSHGARRLDGNG
ncbi:ANTAR domain-containing protein [Streptomyces sp. NPDC093094]|uniref:ANTAR domain-containing protein n=1 Tax=Streptomyces sp. NPDC093094 TaxID=3366026 RepID=UPI003813095B